MWGRRRWRTWLGLYLDKKNSFSSESSLSSSRVLKDRGRYPCRMAFFCTEIIWSTRRWSNVTPLPLYWSLYECVSSACECDAGVKYVMMCAWRSRAQRPATVPDGGRRRWTHQDGRRRAAWNQAKLEEVSSDLSAPHNCNKTKIGLKVEQNKLLFYCRLFYCSLPPHNCNKTRRREWLMLMTQPI